MSLYGPVDKTLTNRFINPDLASGGFTFPGSVISNGEMVVPDSPFPAVGISYGWTGTANNSASVELRGSQEVRRNNFPDPRLKQGTSYLQPAPGSSSGSAATITQIQGLSPNGFGYARLTVGIPATSPDQGLIVRNAAAGSTPAGKPIRLSFELRDSRTRKVLLITTFYAGGVVTRNYTTPEPLGLEAGTWQRVVTTLPLAGSEDGWYTRVYPYGTANLMSAGETLDIADVMVGDGTYFDGDTVSTMDTIHNETIIIKAKNAGQYLRVGETIHQTRTDDEFIRATGTGDLLLSGGSWSGPVTIVPDRYKGDPFSGESDYIYIRKDITARTSWEGAVNASPSIASYQISEEWARDIHWDDYSSRYYESGLDRGVLYLQDGTSVPWIGLREVNIDDYEGADVETYYVDGLEYLSVTGRGESKGTLSAFTSPEEFDRCAGYDTIHNGAYITGQSHEEFGLAYRTFAGDALGGPQSGYKIHLLYGVLAVPSSMGYQTLSADPNLIDLSWDIKATRVIFGTPPKSTAHVIIDTRYAYSSAVTALEKVLYGADGPARLPSPDEVKTIIEENAGLRVVDNGDGTFTLIAENEAALIDYGDYFTINWPTAVDLGNGRFEVSSL